MTISPEIQAKVSEWEAGEVDQENQAQIKDLLNKENWAELNDCFYGMLEFGTAGLRGVIGPGPNRMNMAVVMKTSLGLLETLQAKNMDRGIVVGFDGRQKSKEFAHTAVGVFLAHGIRVYLFKEYAPTPLVAYGVLQQKASAGIVITASHNPPEYNGYKVYWQNGAQIIPPIDAEIKNNIERSGLANQIEMIPANQIFQHKLLQMVDQLGESYREKISSLGQDTAFDDAANLTIAYTPMHGVGGAILERVFRDNGFQNIHTVKEQARPDGKFPTVNFPNPEEKGAMDLVTTLAEEVGADILIANDPDADRLAAAVRDEENKFVMLTGNEIGVILGHHTLNLPNSEAKNSLVVNSIVSTSLLGRIAKEMGAEHAETLTGFKWITNIGMQIEKEKNVNFIFGFEEALGSTVGTVVRDKDGISAALVFSKLAANLKKENKNIWSYLRDIYREFGLFQTRQRSITLKGQEGLQKIQDIMKNTRKGTPKNIGRYAIERCIDIEKGVVIDKNGGQEPLNMAKSNVIIFDLAGDNRVILRPSGTEPKLKIYYEVRFDIGQENTIKAAKKETDRIIDELDQAVQESFIDAAA